MKALLLTVLVLVGGSALALFVKSDPGYVLIGYSNWTMEMSLVLFVISAVIFLLLGYFSLRVLGGMVRSPRNFKKWRTQRNERKHYGKLQQGLMDSAEGQWKKAEKNLLSYVRDSHNPRPAYLAAAKVAQAQGANDRRDHYLALAHRSAEGDDDDVAVQVMKAELQLDNGQWEEALASLVRLRALFPKNIHILVLLATIYQRVKDWAALSEILPELKKRRALSYDRMAELEMSAYEGKLDNAFKAKDNVDLHNAWNRIPKTMHSNEVLLMRYLRYMISRREYAMAEPLVRAALKRRWNEKMAYLYGLLTVENPVKTLAWMEHFLATNENNPVLLHTLGKLAMQAQLWGKARSYLEAAASRGGEPDSYFNLAKLLDEVEEPDAAAECYRKGLSLASEQRQKSVLQADILPA